MNHCHNWKEGSICMFETKLGKLWIIVDFIEFSNSYPASCGFSILLNPAQPINNVI